MNQMSSRLIRGLFFAGLTLGGFAFAVYLIYVQVALIEAFCIWCLASDAVLAVLVLVSLLRLRAVARPAPAA